MKRLVVTSRAARDLALLDQGLQVRILSALQQLAEDNVGDVKRLQAQHPPQYRLRVGDWRVRFVYSDPTTISVTRILHRKDAYR